MASRPWPSKLLQYPPDFVLACPECGRIWCAWAWGRGSPLPGGFREWPGTLPIRFNTAVFTHEQIINLFNLGGVACGIGEWRPERRPFRHVSCDLKKPAGHSRTWLGERGKAM